MKSLFDSESTRYNEFGNQLHTEVTTALSPIFKFWTEQGYGVREIAHLASWAVNDLEVTAALAAQHLTYQAKKIREEAEKAAKIASLTPRQLDQSIRALLKQGKKIDAIIFRRQYSRDGLLEAKNYVDRIQDGMRKKKGQNVFISR